MLSRDGLNGLTKARLTRILEIGPQSTKPPRMTAQSKDSLLSAIRSALRIPGAARDAMLDAIDAERNEYRGANPYAKDAI